MFFAHSDSELSIFVETWMEVYNEDPENVEINICRILKLSGKEVIKKASALMDAGVKLPGYNRKRFKKLKG